FYLRSPTQLHSFPTRRSSDLTDAGSNRSLGERSLPCLERRLLSRGPDNLCGSDPNGSSEAWRNRDGGPRSWNSAAACGQIAGHRSEEHTSELQSHLNLVCRLL